MGFDDLYSFALSGKWIYVYLLISLLLAIDCEFAFGCVCGSILDSGFRGVTPGDVWLGVGYGLCLQ